MPRQQPLDDGAIDDLLSGAAGRLPDGVQHVLASTVGAVTPFTLPDGPHHHDGDAAGPAVTTTTTEAEAPSSEAPHHDGASGPADAGSDDGTPASSDEPAVTP